MRESDSPPFALLSARSPGCLRTFLSSARNELTRTGFMRPHLFWLSITLFVSGVGTSLFAATQAAPPPRTKIDVSKLGPQVGERVPDFSLKDQNGNTQTLHSIMGPRGAMLVFI